MKTSEWVQNNPGTAKIVGGIACGVLAGGMLGIAHWGRVNVSVGGEVTTSVQSAKIIETYPIKPKECHAGYDTLVTASKAALNLTLNVKNKEIPTGIKASDSYTDVLTSQLCNSQMPGKKVVAYDPATNQVEVSYSPDAFSVVTFPKNPNNQDAFAPPQDSLLMLSAENLAGVLNSNSMLTAQIRKMPYGDDILRGPTRVHNKLRGAAVMQASEVASRQCGPLALRLLQTTYATEARTETRQQLDTWKTNVPNNAVISVKFPSNVSIEDQYTDQRAQMKRDLAASDMTLVSPDISTIKCTQTVAMEQPS